MGHGIAAKLVWLWLGFVITVLAFWRVRTLWIRHHPEREKPMKYSVRLAKRLKERKRVQMQLQQSKTGRRRSRQ